VHYLVAYSGHKSPSPPMHLRTDELAANVAGAIVITMPCCWLTRLVTVGPNLATAFAVAEEIELVAVSITRRNASVSRSLSLRGDVPVIEKFAVYAKKELKQPVTTARNPAGSSSLLFPFFVIILNNRKSCHSEGIIGNPDFNHGHPIESFGMTETFANSSDCAE